MVSCLVSGVWCSTMRGRPVPASSLGSVTLATSQDEQRPAEPGVVRLFMNQREITQPPAGAGTDSVALMGLPSSSTMANSTRRFISLLTLLLLGTAGRLSP